MLEENHVSIESGGNQPLLATSVGRYKSAVAQTKIFRGNGNVFVNTKILKDYFQNNPCVISSIQKPLQILNVEDQLTISIRVSGGGFTGQTNAIKLSVANALIKIDETYRPLLKKEGLLTSSSKRKERKKYGLKKARKAPQFSKR